MTQWIISSSLLILAVLGLRALGRDRLSARMRYALWGLVLLRLLVPVSMGESVLSIWNLVPREEPLPMVQTEPLLLRDLPQGTVAIGPYEPEYELRVSQSVTATEPTVQTEVTTLNWPMVLWLAGMVVTALVLLGCNLRFSGMLRRSRQPVEVPGCPLPVYASAAVETPCLFGLLRPAIYILPGLAHDRTALEHVLAHERTHYRHGDHLWSLLRCLCLVLHWYNPLVWLGAAVSREDGELACDEGALAVLDDSQRTAYGRTLISLTCPGHRGLLTTATTMTGSKRGLAERVQRIAANPRASVAVLLAVLLLGAAAAGAFLTGRQSDRELSGVWRTSAPILEAGFGDNGTEDHIDYEFRKGEGRRVYYADGMISYSRYFTYTVKGSTAALTYYNDTWGDAAEETLSIKGDTLQLKGQNTAGIQPLAVEDPVWTPHTVPQPPFLTDALFTMDYVRMAEQGREYRTEAIDNLCVWLLEYFRAAEVQILEGGAADAPNDERAYAFCGGPRTLYIRDGVLYDDTNGYLLSNMNEILDFLERDMRWFPVEPVTNAQGLTYYEADPESWHYSALSRDALYIRMTVPAGMGKSWYFLPEDRALWRSAIAEAMEASVTARPEDWETADGGFVLCDDEMGLRMYKDGCILTGEDAQYYVTPETGPRLMELLYEYLALYTRELSRAPEDADTVNDGSWLLEGTVPDYGITGMAFLRQQIFVWTNSGVITKGCARTVLDGRLLLRLDDGGEYRLPCRQAGETLYVTMAGREYSFRQQPYIYESIDSMSHMIRFEPSADRALYPQTLADDRQQALEQLIRQGLRDAQPGDTVIPGTMGYYRLPCLGPMLDTEGTVILTDDGTLRYEGQARVLTNSAEVLALLAEALKDTDYLCSYPLAEG